MLMWKCLQAILMLMLVILMLILMLLYLNTGYADANADLCIRRIVKLSFTSLAFFNKDNEGVCCKHLYSPVIFKRISIKHVVQFSFHSFLFEICRRDTIHRLNVSVLRCMEFLKIKLNYQKNTVE